MFVVGSTKQHSTAKLTESHGWVDWSWWASPPLSCCHHHPTLLTESPPPWIEEDLRVEKGITCYAADLVFKSLASLKIQNNWIAKRHRISSMCHPHDIGSTRLNSPLLFCVSSVWVLSKLRWYQRWHENSATTTWPQKSFTAKVILLSICWRSIFQQHFVSLSSVFTSVIITENAVLLCYTYIITVWYQRQASEWNQKRGIEKNKLEHILWHVHNRECSGVAGKQGNRKTRQRPRKQFSVSIQLKSVSHAKHSGEQKNPTNDLLQAYYRTCKHTGWKHNPSFW